MDLLAIRKQFIKQSGRRDLIVDTDTYADNGADWFIQSGQRFLDRLLPTQKDSALLRSTVNPDKNSLDLPRNRAVKRVWVLPNSEVTKMKQESFHKMFGIDGMVEGIDPGKPVYYTIEFTRTTVDDNDIQKATQTIILAPVPDKEYNVGVQGLFLSDTLESDDHTSFWSINHPDTLVQGALYALERFYRNTQGMRDHMEAIQRDIQGIDFDVVEQEIAGDSVMNDSFNHGRRSNYGV